MIVIEDSNSINIYVLRQESPQSRISEISATDQKVPVYQELHGLHNIINQTCTCTCSTLCPYSFFSLLLPKFPHLINCVASSKAPVFLMEVELAVRGTVRNVELAIQKKMRPRGIMRSSDTLLRYH